MGMYTGLRCKLKIKPQFVHIINDIINKPTIDGIWRNHGYDFTDKFSEIDRSVLIPYGHLQIFPWNENDPEWQLSFVDNVWTFQCSLKNYEDEIQSFLDLIVMNIVEEVYHLEELYEECSVSALYELHDGIIVKVRDCEYEAF